MMSYNTCTCPCSLRLSVNGHAFSARSFPECIDIHAVSLVTYRKDHVSADWSVFLYAQTLLCQHILLQHVLCIDHGIIAYVCD